MDCKTNCESWTLGNSTASMSLIRLLEIALNALRSTKKLKTGENLIAKKENH